MNKKIWWSLAAIVVIIIIIFIFRGNSGGTKQVIKIGVVAPVSGSYAAYGATLAKGVQMAAADLSKQQTKYSYQVIVEDDTSNAATAASAASKLINIDKVKAIITTTSGSGNAVKSQAAAAGVIHVCDCTDVSIGNAPYNFTNLILPKDEARAWLTEAQRRGNTKIAILAQIHPGAKALIDALLPQVASTSLRIVSNESFDGNSRDFNTLVTKAKSSGADIYLIEGYPPSLDIISKELMNAGIKNISTMGLFTTSPNPAQYNGLWYTDATLTDPALKTRFETAYPDIRFNARTVPYGYDIFNMLVQSFEKDGDASSNLKSITEYDGKVGKVTKAADSSNFRSEAAIWTVQDGDFVQNSKN